MVRWDLCAMCVLAGRHWQRQQTPHNGKRRQRMGASEENRRGKNNVGIEVSTGTTKPQRKTTPKHGPHLLIVHIHGPRRELIAYKTPIAQNIVALPPLAAAVAVRRAATKQHTHKHTHSLEHFTFYGAIVKSLLYCTIIHDSTDTQTMSVEEGGEDIQMQPLIAHRRTSTRHVTISGTHAYAECHTHSGPLVSGCNKRIREGNLSIGY